MHVWMCVCMRMCLEGVETQTALNTDGPYACALPLQVKPQKQVLASDKLLELSQGSWVSDTGVMCLMVPDTMVPGTTP